ncbi:hypothetical protein [Pseudomonas sp. PLMAX]|uniref:hypothetical protein n=1 Tax=Pseudomonas sp. PLMAX TaxID=2201998 RepID=UPI0038BAA1B5
MNTLDLDLKSLKSIESALHEDLGLVKDQLQQVTATESPEEFTQLNTLRLKRSITTSVLHDVQSRIKIAKARVYEQKFVSIANELYPQSVVTTIPPEFKPEVDPTNEIQMLEQTRVFVYQKLESAELSRMEFEDAIRLLPSPVTPDDLHHLSKLQEQKERAEQYFNKQSVKVLRIRKRLYNLYSRLADRKIYTLTLARLNAEQHETVETRATLKPVLRKRKLT